MLLARWVVRACVHMCECVRHIYIQPSQISAENPKIKIIEFNMRVRHTSTVCVYVVQTTARQKQPGAQFVGFCGL